VSFFDPVAFSAAVLALLDGVSGLSVYDGEVPKTPPLSTADGRVLPYVVLYAGAGTPIRDSLSAASSRFDWGWQITAVGGDRGRCLWAVTQADKALLDKRLTISGWSTSRITREPGTELRLDEDVEPPRTMAPLLYRLVAAPTT
jgi:hypothetical protein